MVFNYGLLRCIFNHMCQDGKLFVLQSQCLLHLISGMLKLFQALLLGKIVCLDCWQLFFNITNLERLIKFWTWLQECLDVHVRHFTAWPGKKKYLTLVLLLMPDFSFDLRKKIPGNVWIPKKSFELMVSKNLKCIFSKIAS